MQGWIHFTTAKPVTFLLSTFLGTSSAVNFSFAQWPNLSKQFSMILSSWDNSNTLSNCQALWLLMEGPFISHKRSAWWRRGEQRNRPTEVWFSSCWRTERKSQPKHFPETSTSLALKPSLSESYTCKIWQSTFNFPNLEQSLSCSQLRAKSDYLWCEFFPSFMDHRCRLFSELLPKKKEKGIQYNNTSNMIERVCANFFYLPLLLPFFPRILPSLISWTKFIDPQATG